MKNIKLFNTQYEADMHILGGDNEECSPQKNW